MIMKSNGRRILRLNRGEALQASVYHVAKFLAAVADVLSPQSEPVGAPGRLLIEAGEVGWAEPAPGLLELEQSAKEYLGVQNVFRLEVPRGTKSYIRRCCQRILEVRPTHYFYDTRTGSQNPFWGSIQAIVIAVVLAWFRSSPLTILTNFPARRWRRQVSALTAQSGLILVLIRSDEAKIHLPHARVCGPIFMPFSNLRLQQIRKDFPRGSLRKSPKSVTFVGTSYEPRKTRLDEIGLALSKIGIKFIRHERSPQDAKISQERYWRVLRESPVVLTTADHIVKKGADFGFPPHMVYRYTEALVAEACLIAPDLGGPLEPWFHFVPLGQLEDMDATATHLFETRHLVEEISRRGSAFITRRIENQSWWREVDDALVLFQQRPLKVD